MEGQSDQDLKFQNLYEKFSIIVLEDIDSTIEIVKLDYIKDLDIATELRQQKRLLFSFKDYNKKELYKKGLNIAKNLQIEFQKVLSNKMNYWNNNTRELQQQVNQKEMNDFGIEMLIQTALEKRSNKNQEDIRINEYNKSYKFIGKKKFYSQEVLISGLYFFTVELEEKDFHLSEDKIIEYQEISKINSNNSKLDSIQFIKQNQKINNPKQQQAQNGSQKQCDIQSAHENQQADSQSKEKRNHGTSQKESDQQFKDLQLVSINTQNKNYVNNQQNSDNNITTKDQNQQKQKIETLNKNNNNLNVNPRYNNPIFELADFQKDPNQDSSRSSEKTSQDVAVQINKKSLKETLKEQDQEQDMALISKQQNLNKNDQIIKKEISDKFINILSELIHQFGSGSNQNYDFQTYFKKFENDSDIQIIQVIYQFVKKIYELNSQQQQVQQKTFNSYQQILEEEKIKIKQMHAQDTQKLQILITELKKMLNEEKEEKKRLTKKYQNDLSFLQFQYDESQKKIKQVIDEYKIENTNLRYELKTSQEKIQQMQEINEILQTDLNKEKSECQNKQIQIDKLLEEHQYLKNQIDELKSEIQDLLLKIHQQDSINYIKQNIEQQGNKNIQMCHSCGDKQIDVFIGDFEICSICLKKQFFNYA